MCYLSDFAFEFFMMLYHWVADTFFVFTPTRCRKKNISNEKVLITGAGSGLGRALALEFARKGSTIIMWDTNEDMLAEIADKVSDLNVPVHIFACNVADRREVYETAAKVKSVVGKVDILVNNAGKFN